jgi:hypothetical protein
MIIWQHNYVIKHVIQKIQHYIKKNKKKKVVPQCWLESHNQPLIMIKVDQLYLKPELTNYWALLCLAPIGARKALNCKSWLKLERPSHKSMGSYQLQGSSKPKWLGPSRIREVGDDKHVCFITDFDVSLR